MLDAVLSKKCIIKMRPNYEMVDRGWMGEL